jgi:hypothetical protein
VPTRVQSHCRFRKRGTEYVSESGIKWMSGGAKRQCDRALVPTNRWRFSVRGIVGAARSGVASAEPWRYNKQGWQSPTLVGRTFVLFLRQLVGDLD